MENPFEDLDIIKDKKIFIKMKLNPDMTYVQGYKNVYCPKNQDDKNIINHPMLSLLINNKQNFNYNNIVPDDENKFFKLNQVAPQNFFPNIIVGGHNPNQQINPNNFSIYDENNNKIINDGIPDQFKDSFNDINANNNIIINNNNINNNKVVNKEKEKNEIKIENNVNNANNINNINNDIYKKIQIQKDNNNINNINNDNKKDDDKDKKNNLNNNNNEKNKLAESFWKDINKANDNFKNIKFNNDIDINLTRDLEDEKKINDLMSSAINYNSYEDEDKSEKKEEPKQNIEFKIKFLFKDSKEPFEYKTDPDKIFSEVLKAFLEEKNIIKEKLPNAIHNCNVVNQEKTLKENYIKNEDNIYLYNINKNGKQSNIEEDDLEILGKFAKEFKANKFYEYRIKIQEKIKEKNPVIPKFDLNSHIDELIAFLIYKANKSPPGIKILEHEHPLVCCLTNYSWKCNLCQKSKKNDEEKFCCSICDFYMCHDCRKRKDYDRRKAIKRDITPGNEKYREKYLETNLHEHKLIFCITSRICGGETVWNCDICEKKYNTWGFYCTLCEFDLCIDCALNDY